MAEAEDTEEQSGGKGKIIIFAVVLLVAIAASVAGTWFFIGGGDDDEAAGTEEVVEQGPQTALYYNLRPNFVVNFLAGSKPRYLQTELTVMARREEVIDSIIAHSPLIRAQIVDHLSNVDFASIQTNEGKELLREELRELIDVELEAQQGTPGVTEILITNFVLQ